MSDLFRLLIVCFILAIAFGSSLILLSDYITEIGTCEPEEEPSTVVSWGRDLRIISTPTPFSDGKKWLCKERARAKAAEEWVRPYVPITLYEVWTASLISFGILLSPELFAVFYVIVFLLRCVSRSFWWILVDDYYDESYDDGDAEFYDDVNAESCVTDLSSNNLSSSLLTNVENDIRIAASPEATARESIRIVCHSDETHSIDNTLNIKCDNGEVPADDSPPTCDNVITDESLKASDDVNDVDNDRDESDDNTAEVVNAIVQFKGIDEHSSISSLLYDESKPAEASALTNGELVESQVTHKDYHDNTGLNIGNRSKYTNLDIQRAICRVEIVHLLSASLCSTSRKTSLIQPQCQLDAETQDIAFAIATTIDNPPTRDGPVQPRNRLPALGIETISNKVPSLYHLKRVSNDNKKDAILALPREEQDIAITDDAVTNPKSIPKINFHKQLYIKINVQHPKGCGDVEPCNNSTNDSIQIDIPEDVEPHTISSNGYLRLENAKDVEPCDNSSNGSFHVEELATPPQVMINHECPRKGTLLHGHSDGGMYSPALTDYYERRFASAVASLAKKVDQTAGITLEKRMSMMRLQQALQYGKISFPNGRCCDECNAPTIDSERPGGQHLSVATDTC